MRTTVIATLLVFTFAATAYAADDKVEEEATAAARRIAAGAPLVVRWHKKFARRLAQPRAITKSERNEAYACYDTEDFKIGVKAFLAKQKPEFKGK